MGFSEAEREKAQKELTSGECLTPLHVTVIYSQNHQDHDNLATMTRSPLRRLSLDFPYSIIRIRHCG